MSGLLRWSRALAWFCVPTFIICGTLLASDDAGFRRDEKVLAAYRAELARLRGERYSVRLPGPAFFLFGMGPRPKFIYRGGELTEWPSGRVVRKWSVKQETIVPPAYAVWLRSTSGTVHIFEDESGLFIVENGKRMTLATGNVRLPEFKGERYACVLRVLHQEILVNIADGKPVPNFLVYAKPWYRDGAMVAMVLRRTGNIGLISEWVRSLRDAYDRNNAGTTEADNLGEVLYLISCISDRDHPLVQRAIAEAERFRKGAHMAGKTDFAEHPVYQTKWLKFGLKSLGLPDDKWVVPKAEDSYASLFWWDFRDDQIGPEFSGDTAAKYPYLAWARDHLSGGHTGPVAAGDYPLTWETDASQAKYARMSSISADFVSAKTAAPHTWHAAEMFLALLSERHKFRTASID